METWKVCHFGGTSGSNPVFTHRNTSSLVPEQTWMTSHENMESCTNHKGSLLMKTWKVIGQKEIQLESYFSFFRFITLSVGVEFASI